MWSWCYLGMAYAVTDNLEDAIRAFDKVLEINRRCHHAFFEKGKALARLGKPLEAVVSYDRALEISPDNAAILYNKGIALAQREKYDDAIVAFEKALDDRTG